MLTQPNLILRGSGQPLNQSLWWKAGQKGDGLNILNQALTLFGDNIQWQGPSDNYLTPWTGTPLTPQTALFVDTAGLPSVISTDAGVTQFWAIRGIYTDPATQKQYVLWAATGDLADRLTNPSPWYDEKGGTKLAFRIADEPIEGYPGDIELRWVKA